MKNNLTIDLRAQNQYRFRLILPNMRVPVGKGQFCRFGVEEMGYKPMAISVKSDILFSDLVVCSPSPISSTSVNDQQL